MSVGKVKLSTMLSLGSTLNEDLRKKLHLVASLISTDLRKNWNSPSEGSKRNDIIVHSVFLMLWTWREKNFINFDQVLNINWPG